MNNRFHSSPRRLSQAFRTVALASLLFCAGCDTSQLRLLHPRGPLASAGLQAWIVDTAATLLVIGPATLLVFWAAWRYRRINGKGKYVPSWSHSVPIELLCWGAPFAVVVGLGFYALQTSKATDPSAPGVMAEGGSPDALKPPINIDVVTTDWQWLFIYPDRHIAVANKLVIPLHTPIRFRLTSSTVGTDFFIPQLVGQIDIMPGMRTQSGLIADQVGTYQGFASEFNGPGFAWMRFPTEVVSEAEFDQWATKAGESKTHLDTDAFRSFATPTINYDGNTTEFSHVEDDLFDHVMQNTMMGESFPTPTNMTEKKAHKANDGKQQSMAASPSNQEQN